MAAARTSNGLPEFGREKIRYQLFRWIWVLQGNEFGQTGFGSSQHPEMTCPNLFGLISR